MTSSPQPRREPLGYIGASPCPGSWPGLSGEARGWPPQWRGPPPQKGEAVSTGLPSALLPSAVMGHLSCTGCVSTLPKGDTSLLMSPCLCHLDTPRCARPQMERLPGTSFPGPSYPRLQTTPVHGLSGVLRVGAAKGRARCCGRRAPETRTGLLSPLPSPTSHNLGSPPPRVFSSLQVRLGSHRPRLLQHCLHPCPQPRNPAPGWAGGAPPTGPQGLLRGGDSRCNLAKAHNHPHVTDSPALAGHGVFNKCLMATIKDQLGPTEDFCSGTWAVRWVSNKRHLGRAPEMPGTPGHAGALRAFRRVTGKGHDKQPVSACLPLLGTGLRGP